MTREEAVKILDIGLSNFRSSPDLIDMYVKLGMLKLNESPEHSKEIVELIRGVKVSLALLDYVMPQYLSIQSTYDILDALRNAGYEIKKITK